MLSHSPTLEARVAAALDAFPAARRIAVAFSGGLDSSVLLQLAKSCVSARGVSLQALHIHHGLSPNADRWALHCRDVCVRLGVSFAERRVAVDRGRGTGIEEAAREVRYAALGELCTQHGIDLLLTAHHVDDQAETVLLQLLRGSGIAGIAGMEPSNRAPGLLGTESVMMLRPLLETRRVELEQYAAECGIENIEDESNGDPRYARNALRANVMPLLEASFPGFAERFARTARHAQAAQGLLDQMARQDLEHCRDGNALDLERVNALSGERADNLFRHWFATRGLRMPSTAWLHEMRGQLRIAKPEARLCVSHADCDIRRHRNRVYIVMRQPELRNALPQDFVWHGEDNLHFPTFGGSLLLTPAAQGIAIDWLKGRSCTLHHRQGGERLKLAPNRPTRDLKHHYQSHDIPFWEREVLPFVSSAGMLLFAAGLGMDCRYMAEPGQACVSLVWRFHD